MPIPSVVLDHKKAELFVKRTGQQLAAAMNCYLSFVGDQLGLFKSLYKLGSATSDELADETGLHERWVREWLRHQACNEHLEYHAKEERFSISPEANAVLCDEDSPYYFASGFQAFASMGTALERLPNTFKTGLGMSYDEHGVSCACCTEKLNNYVPRFHLTQTILPELGGICERLERGIAVADVGCGAGIAALCMAKAYPNSRFVGYDVSKHALGRARTNAEQWGLDNVSFVNAQDNPLPADHSFGFITTFDMVHDVPFPQKLIEDIYSALNSDGTWLCSDIRSFPKFEDNLMTNPSAPLMYGFSVLVCLSSAMSEPGGAGLGTLGFNEEVARRMTKEAGFSQFRKLDFEQAVNSFYEIRP